MDLEISNKWFLGKSDFAAIEEIRRKVYVEEQKIDEAEEFDSFDEDAVHLLIYLGDKPVATGRIWHEGQDARVGRLAVLKEFRGIGLGDLLIRLLLVKALATQVDRIVISAQSHLTGFYEKFGFQKEGGEYLEAGIPHFRMVLKRENFRLPSKCHPNG